VFVRALLYPDDYQYKGFTVQKKSASLFFIVACPTWLAQFSPSINPTTSRHRHEIEKLTIH
jgi:hypothetical protein